MQPARNPGGCLCPQPGNGARGPTARQIMDRLKVHPELGCGSERGSKQPSRVRRDTSLAVHDLIDALDRYPQLGSVNGSHPMWSATTTHSFGRRPLPNKPARPQALQELLPRQHQDLADLFRRGLLADQYQVLHHALFGERGEKEKEELRKPIRGGPQEELFQADAPTSDQPDAGLWVALLERLDAAQPARPPALDLDGPDLSSPGDDEIDLPILILESPEAAVNITQPLRIITQWLSRNM